MILTTTVKSAQWRNLKPLISTRDDVVKLLGKPKVDRPDFTFYQFESERVSFEFSTGPCGVQQNVWNVPVGTITKIWVEPTTELKLSDLKLQISDYKKEQDKHVLNIYYFIDEIRGSRYGVDVSSNLVTMIEYYPSLDQRKLRCDAISPKP
jgi:hypothetical protein